MNLQEEEFVHFVACIDWLNSAWRLLQKLKTESGNPLFGPAFRFAIVEYCKPYKLSRGGNRRFKLDHSYIPNNLLAAHNRIENSRDQKHAHSDLTVMEARLHVHDYSGQRYTLISQNKITGFEDLPTIDEMISLIEGTLDNMYIQRNILENAL